MNKSTVIDPVCSMTIDPAQAAGSSRYNGETYHFCSRGCQTKFDTAPAQYAGPVAESASCCDIDPARRGGQACC